MTKATMDRLPATAAVLAGGRSQRMGVDKTMLEVGGEPLLARVYGVVREVCAHAIIVTNRPEAVEEAGIAVDADVYRDEVAYQGPLGGLTTAMAATSDEWVFAVAADMPHLEPGVLRSLWAAREGADVVVPVTDKGPEPLLALYRVEACLPAAREALEAGRRRLVAIFPRVRVAEIPAEDLRSVDPELRSLVNVNTPADLADARDAEEPGEPSEHSSHAGRPRRPITARPPRAMPSERPITVYLNDVEVATVQATPSDLEEMGIGFLLAEGLLTERDALEHIDVDAKRGLVAITSREHVPDDLVFRTRYVTSGCGKGITFSSVGHARGLGRIEGEGVAITGESIAELMSDLARSAVVYRDSGGLHAVGLAVGDDLLFVREDVGRHNALDKVLGRAWLDRVDTSQAVLFSTGRISYEMAVKAAKARVPIVVSRSAVTDLAAEIAGELGITLAGYARAGAVTVYTNPERVLVPAADDTPAPAEAGPAANAAVSPDLEVTDGR